MDFCVVCHQVQIREKWQTPSKDELRLINEGRANEIVCPPCSEITDSLGDANEIQMQ
jgi:hypothetical protein